MYGWEPHVLLRHYLEQGLTITAIAERLRCNRRTLQRWVAAGALDCDPTRVRYGPRASVPTRLDPYHPLIRERLATYPELTAVRLFEEVRAADRPAGPPLPHRQYPRQQLPHAAACRSPATAEPHTVTSTSPPPPLPA